MTPSKLSLLLPVLLITIGTGWLLSALGFAPRIDWIWTLSLAALGAMTMVMGGIDKVTVVIGPYFLFASLLSIFRQMNYIRFEVEVPVLVILAGVLLLIVRHPAIPLPRWLDQPKEV